MKPSSAKAKGRLLCKWLKAEILARFTALADDDIKVTSSGAGGEDVQLSPAARRRVPYQFECKSHAAFAGYAFLEQARSHGKHTPIAVVKANNREPVVVMNATDFLNLVSQAYHGDLL